MTQRSPEEFRCVENDSLGLSFMRIDFFLAIEKVSGVGQTNLIRTSRANADVLNCCCVA